MAEDCDADDHLDHIVPSRNASLLGWSLDNDLRLVQQSTLMTVDLNNEPQGAWLPSIVY
jgi:hypothetical protein